jgi:ABC-type multidrug transport system fused ATPase/permease subunit
VLDGARIQAVGTHDELLRTSPIYREIEETQHSEAAEADHE